MNSAINNNTINNYNDWANFCDKRKDNIFPYDTQNNLQVINSYKECQGKLTPVDVSEVRKSKGLFEKDMINFHEKDIGIENLESADQYKKGSIDKLSKVDGKSPYTVEEDIWSPNYLIDNIFNNLMENNSRKYINQLVTKFKYLIIRSPNVYFIIEKKDLSDEVMRHLELYIKDCKTRNEKYMELNYIFTEVIAEITREARPLLLAGWEDKFIELRKKEVNSIRSLVSLRWKLVS